MIKMYKIIYLLLAVCLLTSCETDNNVPYLSIPQDEAQIIEMNVKAETSDDLIFSPTIYASQMIVNWGDGSLPQQFVNRDSTKAGTSMLRPLRYIYPATGTYYVNVRAIKITRLDISKDSARQSIHTLQLTDCRHLKALSCKNQDLKSVNINTSGVKMLELSTLSALEELSVSACDSLLTIVLYKNPVLKTVNLKNNPRMSALSIDAVFLQLPEATSDTRTINLSNNGGDAGCNKSIATQKGWTVNIE